jgi:1,4-alpha-glucan branching enzyme
MAHQVKKHLGAHLHSGGATFTVWAPFAKLVSLRGSCTDDKPLPMESDSDGYWSLSIDEAQAGQTYKYVIETSDGRVLEKNDPRARTITSSDNGQSVIVDNDFAWKVDSFRAPDKNMQVIYEMHIGTFHRPDDATSGTFYTAIEKLDYLVELGITTVELMPITSMAYSNGWGYAPNYIFSVEAMLGGRHGLMSFVDACHERGLAVILDVVYNHFYPSTDLWQFDGWSENNRGGIYFYNDERGDTPWGGRPDYGRPEVRQFILDNVTMWFTEYKLDGLRVDSTIYMRNTAGIDGDPEHDIPDAWSLLQDITELTHKLNPHALVIAEDSSSTGAIVASHEQSGAGFDAQWALGFPHVVRDALGIGAPEQQIDNLINYISMMDLQNITFYDSHDTAANGSVRLNSAAEDQTKSHELSLKKQLLSATILMTVPGVPMLLQGAELLQEGAFNDWQALDWSLSEKHAGSVLAHTHLINLRLNRHANAAALSGETMAIIHTDPEHHVFAYSRMDDTGNECIIIASFHDEPLDEYTIALPEKETDWHQLFYSGWDGYLTGAQSTSSGLTALNDNRATVSLEPYSALIIATS